MRSDHFFLVIILCLSTRFCYAQAHDSHPPEMICGGVNCEGCVPLERQTAPGIAFDLSLSHGTAAIQFPNGTMYDVCLVEGNSMYLAAMKDLALEAKLLHARREGRLPAFDFRRNYDIPVLPFMQKLLPGPAFRAFRYLTCPEAGVAPSRDLWVNALAGMVQALKTRTEYTHGTQNSDVWISVPDFAWQLDPVMERFREAITQVGIDVGRYQRHGKSSITELYGIDDCWEDNCDLPDHRHDSNVLVVDHSNQTLGLSLYKWSEYSLWTDAAKQEYIFDFDGDDEANVRKILEGFLAPIDTSIKRVALTGSGPFDPVFLSALRAVFEADGGLDERPYVRDTQSHIFASARKELENLA